MKRVFALGLVLAAPAAWADEVVLRGGGVVSGEIVARTASTLVIEVGPGRMTLPLSRVERIVDATSDLTVYRQRAARLSGGDVAGWLALARWAEGRELLTQAREAYERVLAGDPGNAEANSALGRVRVAGSWLSAEAANRARGLVDFEGRWVTPEERAAVILDRAAEARGREAAAEAEARAREAEARARAAEADARRAEAEADGPAGGIPYPYVYGGPYGSVVYGGGVYGGGVYLGGVYGGRGNGGRGHGNRGHGARGAGRQDPQPVVVAPLPPSHNNGVTRRSAPASSATLEPRQKN